MNTQRRPSYQGGAHDDRSGRYTDANLLKLNQGGDRRRCAGTDP